MNKTICVVVLSIAVVIFAMNFISAQADLQCEFGAENIFNTTLVADDSFYVIPTVPIAFDSEIQFLNETGVWDVSNVDVLTQEEINYLEENDFNSFELNEGNYVLEILNGAWSRWNKDSIDTNDFGGDSRDGGIGKTWESTAAVVYNNGTDMIIERFGDWRLFSSVEDAEAASVTETLLVNHTGGKMYIVLDAFPIEGNRGSVTVGLFQCKSNESDEDNNGTIDDDQNETDSNITINDALLDIPNNADCYWPPESQSLNDLISISQTRGDQYFGWAYDNELSNIIFIGNEDSDQSNYMDERLLCSEGRWHSTTDDWPYFNLSVARPWGIVVETLGTTIGDWIVVGDNLFGRKWTQNDDDDDDQTAGKIVNLTDFQLENHVSEGYINIVCETNDSTNSVEPWIGRDEPFPGRDRILLWNGDVPFSLLPKLGRDFVIDWDRTKVNDDGTQTAVYKFFVNENLSGTYHIGCWMDNMRNDTDLYRGIDYYYPAVGSIIRLFTFGEENNDTNDNFNDTDEGTRSHRHGNPIVFYDLGNSSHDELGSTPDVIISNGVKNKNSGTVTLIPYSSGNESFTDNVKTSGWQLNIWTIGLIVLAVLILIIFIIIVFLLG